MLINRRFSIRVLIYNQKYRNANEVQIYEGDYDSNNGFLPLEGSSLHGNGRAYEGSKRRRTYAAHSIRRGLRRIRKVLHSERKG